MKERPILFSAPMVRALLAGTKTQTRRAAKVESTLGIDSILAPRRAGGHAATYLLPDQAAEAAVCCPYGHPGDRLWVRETFYAWGRWETRFSSKKGRDEWHFVDMTLECGKAYQYAGDRPQPLAGKRDGGTLPKWFKRPAIHMPRAASRILLEITSVRVERLQAISENDARAEGAPLKNSPAAFLTSHLRGFQELWEDINSPGAWVQNPWVWVVEFKRVQQASSGRPSQLEDAPCSA